MSDCLLVYVGRAGRKKTIRPNLAPVHTHSTTTNTSKAAIMRSSTKKQQNKSNKTKKQHLDNARKPGFQIVGTCSQRNSKHESEQQQATRGRHEVERTEKEEGNRLLAAPAIPSKGTSRRAHQMLLPLPLMLPRVGSVNVVRSCTSFHLCNRQQTKHENARTVFLRAYRRASFFPQNDLRVT